MGTVWLAVAAVAQMFDLSCAGTTITTTYLDGDISSEYSEHYRIDLTRNLWCSDDCKTTQPLILSSPIGLKLEQETVDTSREYNLVSNVINRETGAHHIIRSSQRNRDATTIRIVKQDGVCTPYPFSGFPTPKTKF